MDLLPIGGAVLNERIQNSFRLSGTITRFKPEEPLGIPLFLSSYKAGSPQEKAFLPSGQPSVRGSENSDGITKGNRPLK